MGRMKAENVSYSYRTKYQTVHAVIGVSCEMEEGKLYAITGESGSGKSTFLSLLAGLDVPGEGRILIDGEDLAQMDRDKYRREQVSVIYQAFHLFPLLTVLENVMFPMELRRISRKEAEKEAMKLLENVGIEEKAYYKLPQMMSGGEQQRIAAARAFAGSGKIILADEPTGNLDSENEQKVVRLFQWAAHEKGYTVVLVTHNLEVAKQADVVFRMRDGALVEVGTC